MTYPLRHRVIIDTPYTRSEATDIRATMERERLRLRRARVKIKTIKLGRLDRAAPAR